MKTVEVTIKAEVKGTIEIPDGISDIQEYLDAQFVDIYVGGDNDHGPANLIMDKQDLGADDWTIIGNKYDN